MDASEILRERSRVQRPTARNFISAASVDALAPTVTPPTATGEELTARASVAACADTPDGSCEDVCFATLNRGYPNQKQLATTRETAHLHGDVRLEQ